jgi:hypothetical protein
MRIEEERVPCDLFEPYDEARMVAQVEDALIGLGGGFAVVGGGGSGAGAGGGGGGGLLLPRLSDGIGDDPTLYDLDFRALAGATLAEVAADVMKGPARRADEEGAALELQRAWRASLARRTPEARVAAPARPRSSSTSVARAARRGRGGVLFLASARRASPWLHLFLAGA